MADKSEKNFTFTLAFTSVKWLESKGEVPGWQHAGKGTEIGKIQSMTVPSIAADRGGLFVLTTEGVMQYTCDLTSCKQGFVWFKGGESLGPKTHIKDPYGWSDSKPNDSLSSPMVFGRCKPNEPVLRRFTKRGGQLALDKDSNGVARMVYAATRGSAVYRIDPTKKPDEKVPIGIPA